MIHALLGASILSVSARATDDIPTYELLVERQATIIWPLYAEVEEPEERYAVLANEELRINDRVIVVDRVERFAAIVGNAGSGQTNLGAHSLVDDVVSNGPVHLRDRGFVDGMLRAADRVEVAVGMPYPSRIDASRLGADALAFVEERGWERWSLSEIARRQRQCAAPLRRGS